MTATTSTAASPQWKVSSSPLHFHVGGRTSAASQSHESQRYLKTSIRATRKSLQSHVLVPRSALRQNSGGTVSDRESGKRTLRFCRSCALSASETPPTGRVLVQSLPRPTISIEIEFVDAVVVCHPTAMLALVVGCASAVVISSIWHRARDHGIFSKASAAFGTPHSALHIARHSTYSLPRLRLALQTWRGRHDARVGKTKLFLRGTSRTCSSFP